MAGLMVDTARNVFSVCERCDLETPKKGRISDRPTLADVAKTAGVSTATVSRVLNAPKQVSQKTRDRVQSAVDALGYAPNFNARALAARRSNTIGAVIPTMENAIFARGLQAFEEELGRSGMTLLVASSFYDETVEAEQIRNLAARGADGLLLIGHHRGSGIRDFLRARQIPSVVAWSYRTDLSDISIGFDNRHAMAELTREVLALGHLRLGCISAPTEANDRARDRIAGIQEGMRAAGLDPDTLAIAKTPYSIDGGAEAFRNLLSQDPDLTAVLCGNDVLAVGALLAAKDAGLSVPGDISITGFDDVELARLDVPPLTTVHVPHRDMGQQAAAMLVRMVREDGVVQSVELPTSIRWRNSLGPPPAV